MAVFLLLARWKFRDKLWWECSKCGIKTEKSHKKCKNKKCKHKGHSSKDRECSPPRNHEYWQCDVCTFKENEMEKCEMCGDNKPKRCTYPLVDPDLRNSYREEKKRKRNLARTQRKKGSRSVRVTEQRRSDEERAMMFWKNITLYCKNKNTPFVDNTFPAPEDPSATRNKVWLRLKDIKFPSHTVKVVYDESSSRLDVKQGELDDCWFSAALAVLGERHDMLKKILLTREICDEGAYYVRLCKDGIWKTVLIDDRFPCHRSTEELIYSRVHVCNGKLQLWPLLIRKAAAKLHKSFNALCEGLVVEALAMLTGEPCDFIVINEIEDKKQNPLINKEDIWFNLNEAKRERFLMGISTPWIKTLEGFDKTGLMPFHSYAVVDVTEIEGEKLIKLYTPWSKEYLRGCLNNTDSKIKSLIESENLQYEKDELWITFSELLKYFISLGICKARDWYEMRIKGSFPPVMNKPWKYLTFTLFHDTNLHIGLFQKNMRRGGQGGKEDFNDLLITVLENSLTDDHAVYEREPLFKQVMGHSERRARSFVSCDVTLGKGSYTVACFGFMQLQNSLQGLDEEDWTNFNKNFSLVIHSSDELKYPDEVDMTCMPKLESAPADAIILLAKQAVLQKEDEDQRRHVYWNQDTGQNAISYSLLWWGEILVLENNTDQPFEYYRNYSESQYLLFSRIRNYTIDVLSPHTCQVIHVTTAMHPDAGWSVAANVGKRFLNDKDKEDSHQPEVTECQRGLHSLRPIPEIEKEKDYVFL